MNEFRTMLLGEIFLVVSSIFLFFNAISAKNLMNWTVFGLIFVAAFVLGVKIKLSKM